jgi:hypothetical protein
MRGFANSFLMLGSALLPGFFSLPYPSRIHADIEMHAMQSYFAHLPKMAS